MSNDPKTRILARRALFLSSALATAGSASPAGAEEAPSETKSELPPLPDPRLPPPPRYAEPRVCLIPPHDPYNSTDLRRSVRVVAETQTGGVVGLRGLTSAADLRLGLLANIRLDPSDSDGSELRLGLEGTFSTPTHIAVMGKTAILYSWRFDCLTGGNAQMFSGFAFAAGYQGVFAATEKPIRHSSGLRLEPELIPFGIRFGELKKFDLGLHVGLRFSRFVDETESKFGPTGVSVSLGFTWMMFPSRSAWNPPKA